MRAPRPLPAALVVAGSGLVAASLGWWGLTFWPTVDNAYLSLGEAGRCLLADSSLCRLATTLCGARHAVLVVAYSPLALWSGASATFAGIALLSPRTRSRAAAELDVSRPPHVKA